MIYRYPKEGQIAGVCTGLAKHFGLDSRVVRLIFIILFFLGGMLFVPLVYFAAVFLMEKVPENYYALSPVTPFNTKGTATPPSSTAQKINKLGAELDQIKQRISKAEYYTKSRKFRKTW